MLGGFVHAIERIRSYTTRQIRSVTNVFDAMEREEQSLVASRKSARELREQAAETVGNYKRRVIFELCFVLVILAILGASILFPCVSVVAIVLVVLVLCYVGIEFVGLTLPWDIFALRRSLLKARDAEKRVKEITQRLAAMRDRQRDQAEGTIRANRQMLGEIRNFLDLRLAYVMAKDDIPIAIRMDEALSALNDMKFGKISDELVHCSARVNEYARKYDLPLAQLLPEKHA